MALRERYPVAVTRAGTKGEVSLCFDRRRTLPATPNAPLKAVTQDASRGKGHAGELGRKTCVPPVTEK